MTINTYNFSRWRQFNSLLSGYGRLSSDDIKSLVTYEKIDTFSNKVNFRTTNLISIVIIDEADGCIQAFFTGEDYPDDIPDFLMIRSSYGKQ